VSDLSIASKLDPKAMSGGVGSVSSREGLVGTRGRETTGADFRNSLRDALNSGAAVGSPAAQAGVREALKFSAHAVDRMKSRGISFAPDMMKNIESAVARAASKGSRDTLVLAGDNALIVSVKNNTVVTVMDRAAMRENVFTNIDSTVVV
jgi:flagellar operon protein